MFCNDGNIHYNHKLFNLANFTTKVSMSGGKATAPDSENSWAKYTPFKINI